MSDNKHFFNVFHCRNNTIQFANPLGLFVSCVVNNIHSDMSEQTVMTGICQNINLNDFENQGPVVQNFVSLTSSLRPQLVK